MSYLETERVLLRDITKADAALLLELDSDPEVMLFITDGKPSSLEQTSLAIDRILNLQKQYDKKFGLWAAIEKESGNFMGWFHFRPCKKHPEDTKTIELGYRLKKEFWGKGYAPEVSKALIHKGFTELKVETVFAKTMAKNIKSRRVMEKIGLEYECSFIEDEFPGSDKNAVRYSLKR